MGKLHFQPPLLAFGALVRFVPSPTCTGGREILDEDQGMFTASLDVVVVVHSNGTPYGFLLPCKSGRCRNLHCFEPSLQVFEICISLVELGHGSSSSGSVTFLFVRCILCCQYTGRGERCLWYGRKLQCWHGLEQVRWYLTSTVAACNASYIPGHSLASGRSSCSAFARSEAFFPFMFVHLQRHQCCFIYICCMQKLVVYIISTDLKNIFVNLLYFSSPCCVN